MRQVNLCGAWASLGDEIPERVTPLDHPGLDAFDGDNEDKHDHSNGDPEAIRPGFVNWLLSVFHVALLVMTLPAGACCRAAAFFVSGFANGFSTAHPTGTVVAGSKPSASSSIFAGGATHPGQQDDGCEGEFLHGLLV